MNLFSLSALSRITADEVVLAGRLSVARCIVRIAQRAALTGLAGTIVAGNPVWAMSGAALWMAAALYCRRTEAQAAMAGKTAEAAMERGCVTLPATAPLGETYKRVVASAQRFYPVMDGDKVIGLASDEELLRGVLREGADGPVTSVMQWEFPTVMASAPLARVAPCIRARSAPRLVFRQGLFVGMVTYDSLNQYLERERR